MRRVVLVVLLTFFMLSGMILCQQDGTADDQQTVDCTKNDFGVTYSPCDKKTNTRRVVWYKKNDCGPGGEALPVSSKTFSCSLTCQNGQYLTPPYTTCQSCPRGQYSFSEGVKFDDWTKTAEGLKTQCTGKNCVAWRRTSGYIYSGNNTNAHNINSILSYNVDIVRDEGRVEFFYQVDADRSGDGLEFFVDGQQYLYRVSYTNNYVMANFTLSRGPHALEWMYKKNARTSKGKDRAMIKWIKIYGSKLFDESCSECAPGTYSDKEGQHYCQPCPADSVSNIYGAKKCEACSEGYYAPEGSSTCTKKPICISKDYTSYFTDCSGGKRTKKWRKLSQICQGGFTAPPDQEDLECPACPDGLYRDEETWKCVRCEGSQYYDKQSNTCKSCNSGEAALKVLRYDKHYFGDTHRVPEGWDTQCYGYCSDDDKGWQVVTSTETDDAYLVSSTAGGSETMTISFTANLYTRGRVIFEYIIENVSDDPSSATLTVYSGDYPIAQIDSSSGPKGDGKDKFVSDYMPPGSYDLYFSFERYDSYDKNARLIIKSLIIEGESSGAADVCSECPAGYQCRAGVDQFTPCPVGHYSKLKSETCDSCPPDTFADEIAQAECKTCGYGTHAPSGATQCDTDCIFTIPGAEDIVYNLNDLQQQQDDYLGVIGPFSPDATNKLMYYFNLCKRFDTSTTNFCHAPQIGAEYSYDQSNATQFFSAYACGQDTEYQISENAGQLLSYQQLDVAKRNQGLNVILDSPIDCGENQNVRTVVHLRCDPAQGLGYPTLTTKFKPEDDIFSKCLIEYEWNSAVACPLCTKYDYDSVTSKCENGKRTKTYFYKKDVKCYASYLLNPLPQDEVVECPVCTEKDMTTIDTKCVDGQYQTKYVWIEPKNCTDGIKLPKPINKVCEEVELQRNTAIFIVAIAVLLFGFLFVGLVWMYRKHQQLYENYTILSNATGGEPQELGTIDYHDDDDDEDEDSDSEKV